MIYEHSHFIMSTAPVEAQSGSVLAALTVKQRQNGLCSSGPSGCPWSDATQWTPSVRAIVPSASPRERHYGQTAERRARDPEHAFSDVGRHCLDERAEAEVIHGSERERLGWIVKG